ncbi:hypothetical protein N185_16545 [Sinorhizobium sp. GW3]|nr:hypothetical protein N185_16545 [Sinorhizobium sp. GW3]
MTVLPDVPSPARADIYEGRIEDCQAAVEEAFQALVRHCRNAGWRDDDVAIALTEVAEDHFQSVGYTPAR